MSALHETAYPRFKSDLTEDELTSIYTPSDAEIRFARRQFKVQSERLAFLIQLKTVQRLGYFVKASEVPTAIRSHIAACAGFRHTKKTTLEKLNTTGARHRLRKLIRTRLKIKPYESGGSKVVSTAAAAAASTLHELADIILKNWFTNGLSFPGSRPCSVRRVRHGQTPVQRFSIRCPTNSALRQNAN